MLRVLKPNFFIRLSTSFLLIIFIIMLSLFIIGLFYAIKISPPDYQQGEIVRIMYVHVPAAWMGLAIYTFIAICSFLVLVIKGKMFYIFAVSASPIGAVFTLITLITGSLWGIPIWGTWWVWDARLTSMLILFFLYIIYIIIVSSGTNMLRAEKPASVIALIGFINIPIVKFSVNIWYGLHQPASIMKLSAPSIHYKMLIPLFIMFLTFILYFFLVWLLRVRMLILKLKIVKNNDLCSY